MDDAEFRERMDHHMVRSDEVLREIRDEVALTREEVRHSREQRARSDALMDRLNERLDRDAEAHSDLRVFIREMIVRMERSGQELAVGVRAGTVELQRFGRQLSVEMEEARDSPREDRACPCVPPHVPREESRAQRSALLRLFDRFDGPEPGSAAGTA